MKKTFSKDQLQEKAGEYFKKLGVSKLFATADGQFFILKNRAEIHAGKGKVYEFHVQESKSSDEGDEDFTVKEIETIADQSTDTEQLETMLRDEQDGKNRKSAVKVLMDRIEELKGGKQ